MSLYASLLISSQPSGLLIYILRSSYSMHPSIPQCSKFHPAMWNAASEVLISMHRTLDHSVFLTESFPHLLSEGSFSPFLVLTRLMTSSLLPDRLHLLTQSCINLKQPLFRKIIAAPQQPDFRHSLQLLPELTASAALEHRSQPQPGFS